MHTTQNQQSSNESVRFGAHLAYSQKSAPRSVCPASDLALFALRGQAVSITSPLLVQLEEQLAVNTLQFHADNIQNCAPILRAFVAKGIITKTQLSNMCDAVKQQPDDISAQWRGFINDGLNELMQRLNDDVDSHLIEVENIRPLLQKIREKYCLYSLSIQNDQCNDSEYNYALTLQDNDFMQHVYTGLDAIEDRPLQGRFKTLLDDLMRFGGIWQTDLCSSFSGMEWDVKTREELDAVTIWCEKIKDKDPTQLRAMVSEAEINPLTRPFIEFILESMEDYIGDCELDNEESRDWLLERCSYCLALGNAEFFVRSISSDAAGCPSKEVSLVSRQIDGLRQACAKQFGDVQKYTQDWLPSFSLHEENMQFLSFVLSPFEDNEALNAESQSNYEHFCNAGESQEIYNIDVGNGTWYQDLLDIVFAMTTMLVAVESVLDSLPDARHVG